MRMKVTVTTTLNIMVADSEELDAICEDIHEQFGRVMVGNDWMGAVEVSWETVPD